MNNHIPAISIKRNVVYAPLEKVCDDLYDALMAARRALKDAQQVMDDMPCAPPVDMDEIRVRHWLRGQQGTVTSAHVADALFDGDSAGKSLSMRVARYLRRAGWRHVKKVRGARHWGRGQCADPVIIENSQ